MSESDQTPDAPKAPAGRGPGSRTRREDRITIGWVWRNLVPALAIGLAAYAVAGVQSSRYHSALDACREQNTSNQNTAAAVRAAPERDNVDKGIVIGLINALAPYHPDCEAWAHKRVDVP